MDQIEFPQDFSEFLTLLIANEVEFLLIGGFAVAVHGYPRATADLDIWVARNQRNAKKLVESIREFGFDTAELTPDLFADPNKIVRMGNAPIRIEILTDIDGVTFEDCRSRAIVQTVDGTRVPVISLSDLKINKRASARPKDLDDLENLP